MQKKVLGTGVKREGSKVKVESPVKLTPKESVILDVLFHALNVSNGEMKSMIGTKDSEFVKWFDSFWNKVEKAYRAVEPGKVNVSIGNGIIFARKPKHLGSLRMCASLVAYMFHLAELANANEENRR